MLRNDKKMADPNMDIIYSWAEQLGTPPAIPTSMKEPEDIARFVDFVDKNIFANSEFWKFSVAERQEFLTDIAERTKNHISDIKDSNQRTNITLRLWASCLSAERRCAKRMLLSILEAVWAKNPILLKCVKTLLKTILILSPIGMIYIG